MPRIFFAGAADAPDLGAKMEQTLVEFAPSGRSADLNYLICKRILGRGKRIRTSGPCVPNAVLYQAELFPDTSAEINSFSQLQSPTIVAAYL